MMVVAAVDFHDMPLVADHHHLAVIDRAGRVAVGIDFGDPPPVVADAEILADILDLILFSEHVAQRKVHELAQQLLFVGLPGDHGKVLRVKSFLLIHTISSLNCA